MVSELQPYIKTNGRVNPVSILDIEEDINQLNGWHSKCRDFVYFLLRYQSAENQIFPSWKGFFYEVEKECGDRHTVAYLPTTNKSPTKMDTVQEILFQVKEKAEALNHKETDLVLDHAIYCKAVEIVMQERNEKLRKFINLRMGGFHATCIFLGVIGKRFGDGGLKNLIVESGLLGDDQASPMLKGKDNNNGIRVHLYIAEAITRMKHEAFENWLVTKNKYGIYSELKDMDEVHAFQKDHNTENFEQCVNIFQPILELFEDFEHLLSDTEEYPMAAYWTSYLDMVQTLRDFSKSIKIGDWDLHMYASEKMLHWFHAYDNYNYARHFSYYWATQQVLPVQNPAIYEEFKRGGFPVQQTIGKFNKVSPDQVIEQTINKDQEGPGIYL